MRGNAGKIAVILVLWLAAVAVVITGELLPAASAPMQWLGAFEISDKVMHFSAYVLLAFIPCFGFPLGTGLSLSALLIALGVALEFAQKLVPGRSFDLKDALANALGVALGAVLGVLAGRLRMFRHD
ncbi:MAG TPA: VanZ family protein [Bryobacteraceae bacterium]|nr:VanZ family protein [Bryobacteraceae bacterium]